MGAVNIAATTKVASLPVTLDASGEVVGPGRETVFDGTTSTVFSLGPGVTTLFAILDASAAGTAQIEVRAFISISSMYKTIAILTPPASGQDAVTINASFKQVKIVRTDSNGGTCVVYKEA